MKYGLPAITPNSYNYSNMHFVSLLILLEVLVPCASAGPYEHVVLADCLSPAYIRISHMAYYNATITDNPQTVAVISTPPNETAVWIRNESRPLFATFPDGVSFTANISATINEGDFAGNGSNGWGSFKCWRYHTKALYTWYSKVTCDAVYDCNHQDRAGDSQSPNGTGIALTPVSPASNSSLGDSKKSEGEADSNKSDNIALGVGIGIGFPSLAATIAAVWYARRRPAVLERLHLTGLKSGDDSTLRPSDGNEAGCQINVDIGKSEKDEHKENGGE